MRQFVKKVNDAKSKPDGEGCHATSPDRVDYKLISLNLSNSKNKDLIIYRIVVDEISSFMHK